MSKIAVVAIGGNSLIKDKDHQTVPDQMAAVNETCIHIAKMVKAGYDVVITHGNGPQVGFILRRSEIASHELHEVPLVNCGADTQGAIGYQIQQALQNEFKKQGIEKAVATVVTQVLVDKNDPAFKNPSKPIGSFMNEGEALIKKEKEGWDIKEDSGRGFRRVVASPIPMEVVELEPIKQLIKADMCVVAVGGGGIPVIRNDKGFLEGKDAVIDKDFASSLLATNLNADILVISTAVEKVYLNYNKPDQKALDTITLAEAKKFQEEGHFAAGSMGPKIKAIIQFIEKGGKKGLITSPEKIAEALNGQTGTYIVP